MKSAQEFFDFTVNAIRQQGRPSGRPVGNFEVASGDYSPGEFICLYRGPDGMKCAAGHHITDEQYMPEMENKSATAVAEQFLPPDHPLFRYGVLANELQTAHDNAAKASLVSDPDEEDSTPAVPFLDGFNSRVALVAKDFDLVYTEPVA